MPKSLAVVGAGPTGCEYACIMALLGCAVSLIDVGDTLLPFLDSEISTLLQESLAETGIDFMAATRVDKVSEGPPFTLSLDNGGELKADAIVVPRAESGIRRVWRWRMLGSRATRASSDRQRDFRPPTALRAAAM